GERERLPRGQASGWIGIESPGQRGRARGAQIGVPSPPGPRAEERFQPVRITPLQRSQDVPAGIAVAVEDDPLKPDLPLLSQSADRVGGLCLRLKLVSEAWCLGQRSVYTRLGVVGVPV